MVVVGGGFAGVACARRLAGQPGVRVTLLDRNGYHQLQPLLYQVATAELTPDDIRFDLGAMFAGHDNIEVRTSETVAADPAHPAVALAELAHDVMLHVHPQLAAVGARVILVDHGHAVLGPFSDEAHEYAARQLQQRGGRAERVPHLADEFHLRSHHRPAALLDPATIDTPASTGTTADGREGGPTSGQRGVRGRGWKPAAR